MASTKLLCMSSSSESGLGLSSVSSGSLSEPPGPSGRFGSLGGISRSDWLGVADPLGSTEAHLATSGQWPAGAGADRYSAQQDVWVDLITVVALMISKWLVRTQKYESDYTIKYQTKSLMWKCRNRCGI
jgi:hypothetical protein